MRWSQGQQHTVWVWESGLRASREDFVPEELCLFVWPGWSVFGELVQGNPSPLPNTHRYFFCLTWNSSRADWPYGRQLPKHWKTKNKPLLPGAKVTVWETIDTEKIQEEELRGDFWGEHIFERFPYILGNLERHVYTQGGHMLRKIERKSYDFILPELYAKRKQEVKAKAESKNGVTRKEWPNKSLSTKISNIALTFSAFLLFLASGV